MTRNQVIERIKETRTGIREDGLEAEDFNELSVQEIKEVRNYRFDGNVDEYHEVDRNYGKLTLN